MSPSQTSTDNFAAMAFALCCDGNSVEALHAGSMTVTNPKSADTSGRREDLKMPKKKKAKKAKKAKAVK